MILDLGTGSDPMGFLKEEKIGRESVLSFFTLVKITFRVCGNSHQIKELWNSSWLYVPLGNESGYMISVFSCILSVSSAELE